MFDMRGEEDAAVQPHGRARQEQLQLINSQLREEDDKWQDVSAGARALGSGEAVLPAGPEALWSREAESDRVGASGWKAVQKKGRGWRRRLNSEHRPCGN